MTAVDDYSDLVPLLDRLSLEQIPVCDRPQRIETRPVFGLPAACPRCAGPLTLVNSKAEETLAIGIMHCPPCRREFEITVRLVQHPAVG